MSIYYLIYKTTNLVTNKIYIGKHITDNLNDEYLGSGKWLINSIKKYGKENFKKDILFIFDNEIDMNNKEIEIVNLEFILREDTYNLVLGGNGGQIVLTKGHPKYDETRNKIKQSRKGQRHWTNGVVTVFSKVSPGNDWYIGRAPSEKFKFTEEQKQKVKDRMSAGAMSWWNNGAINKRGLVCPGKEWVKGRIIKNSNFTIDKDYLVKYRNYKLKNLKTNEIILFDNKQYLEFKKLNTIGKQLKPRKRSHSKGISWVLIERY
jgi:hypothetical protein